MKTSVQAGTIVVLDIGSSNNWPLRVCSLQSDSGTDHLFQKHCRKEVEAAPFSAGKPEICDAIVMVDDTCRLRYYHHTWMIGLCFDKLRKISILLHCLRLLHRLRCRVSPWQQIHHCNNYRHFQTSRFLRIVPIKLLSRREYVFQPF